MVALVVNNEMLRFFAFFYPTEMGDRTSGYMQSKPRSISERFVYLACDRSYSVILLSERSHREVIAFNS
jgi:hypothetical protein